MPLTVAHTGQLEAATLDAARALLGEVFPRWSDEDWEHTLGGVHALAWEDGALVGHGAVVQRRLLYGGRALRAGYVESVGVRASARRRGHATAIMRALGAVIERAYDLGALDAADEAAPLYERLGWRRWQGPLSALTPAGIRPTPDERGGVFVLAAGLDVTRELTCDWRDGSVW